MLFFSIIERSVLMALVFYYKDMREKVTMQRTQQISTFVSYRNNLVPRAHVPFGQHQDTELWNNQFPETKILGLPASRRMRGMV